MKKALFILFFVNFYCYLFSQEIGYPIIRNYSAKEYNSAPQVLSIIQSKKGFLYCGVGGGILEYDGVSWRKIPNEKNATPYDFASDSAGVIYVAANGDFGYLASDSLGNTAYKSLARYITDASFKLGTVFSVECSDTLVFFQTNDAILQYSPKNTNLLIFKADTFGIFTHGFVHKNVYYTHLFKKGLVKIENNTFSESVNAEQFKGKYHYNASVALNSDLVLIPTDTEGVYVFNPKIANSLKQFNINNTDFFSQNFLSTAAKSGNNIILGSINKGALLIDSTGKAIQHFDENTLLQNNFVRAINTDKSGNIWFGLSTGISKTDQGTELTYWDKSAGLKDIVESIVRYKNTMFFATHQKVYYLNTQNKIIEVEGIPTGVNWSFLQAKASGTLLVGTSTGIYEIVDKKAKQIYKGGRANELYQSELHPERIYSTDADNFIALKFENGKWQLEHTWKAVKDNIRGIIEEPNGDIWLGTFRNGAIRIVANKGNSLKPNLVRYYNKQNGFISLKNVLPFKFRNKIIWGTETGLFIYNSKTDSFEPFCELGEQFCSGSRDVFSLIEMPDGKIWICPLENEKAEIGYLQPKTEGGYTWVFEPFKRLSNMFLVSFYIEPDGTCWLGGSEGVYRYNFNEDKKNYANSFDCYIRKVSIGQDSLVFGGNAFENNKTTKEIKFKFEHNSVVFEFAAPFFDREDKTLYSYRLTGYDKQWSKWSTDVKKGYTNLLEGNYNFEVKALNAFGKESTVDAYKFRILPPWYRTWWAILFYIAGSIASIIAFTRLYTRNLIKQKENLELIVKQRTFEVLQQNEEILTQRDELEKKNKYLEQANTEISNQAEQLVCYSKELEKLSIVADKTDNSIIVLDPDGNFIWINDAFTRLFGYNLSNLPAERKNIYTASSNPDIALIIKDCIENKKSNIYDSVNYSQAGNAIWVQTTITPIFDENGTISKLIAIDADISKLKEAERQILEQKNLLQSSIRYAKTIQNAILPNSKLINTFFEHFIIYYPKDIVSGDFYWFNTVNTSEKQLTYASVADCTGHGVPGAFMSMIGSRLLSEIINERHIYEPNKVLSALNLLIRKALKQDESENSDGMDIALCSFEPANDQVKVCFSGAKSRIYVFLSNEGRIVRHEGDKIMLGGNKYSTENEFTNHELLLNKGDIIYFLSDGIIDQNNVKRKRFGSIQFMDLLRNIALMPIAAQKDKIEEALNFWMTDTVQRDDITVFAIKI